MNLKRQEAEQLGKYFHSSVFHSFEGGRRGILAKELEKGRPPKERWAIQTGKGPRSGNQGSGQCRRTLCLINVFSKAPLLVSVNVPFDNITFAVSEFWDFLFGVITKIMIIRNWKTKHFVQCFVLRELPLEDMLSVASLVCSRHGTEF